MDARPGSGAVAVALARVRRLSEWTLVIDAALAAFGIQVIVYGLYFAVFYHLYSIGTFQSWEGPPPHFDIPIADRVVELLFFAATVLVVRKSVRVEFAAAGLYGLVVLPAPFSFDLWDRICDRGDSIAHCVDAAYATVLVIELLAGVIAGSVYVYRGGTSLPVVAAILLSIPTLVVFPHQWRFVQEDGIWFAIILLSRLLGSATMLIAAFAWPRYRSGRNGAFASSAPTYSGSFRRPST